MQPQEGFRLHILKVEQKGRGGEYPLITKEMPIMTVLRLLPQAREVFIRHGMGCIGCMGSATETIEKGAKMHDVDLETLLKELNALEPEE